MRRSEEEDSGSDCQQEEVRTNQLPTLKELRLTRLRSQDSSSHQDSLRDVSKLSPNQPQEDGGTPGQTKVLTQLRTDLTLPGNHPNK